MTLPDPHGSRAVLVGCANYTALEPLPAVERNVRRLADLLADPEVWGLPPDNCTVLIDPESAEVVLEAVHQASSEAEESLVVYFAGHGLLEERTSDLYLALRKANANRLFRAVRYDDLRREVIDTAVCASKVVMLDCCYSGQAMLGGMSGSVEMADQARIEGTYLITASAETKLALAPIGEEFTAFTGEIIAALTLGIPDAAEHVDLETLYWYVRRGLEAKGRPVPQQRARNSGGALPFVRNRYGRPGKRPDQRSVEFDALIGQAPAQLVAAVGEMSERDPGAVPGLLDAIAHTRDDQAVASIVERLRLGGDHEHADRILRTVATRRGADVAALLFTLSDLHRAGDAAVVYSVLAAAPTAALTAIATLIVPRLTLAPLLEAVVEVRTEPADVVQLARGLHDAGLPGAASDLAQRALHRLADFTDLVNFVIAAAGTPLVDEIKPVLRRLMGEASDEQLVTLLERFWAEKLADVPQVFLGEVAAIRPVESMLVLADGLRDIGRPLDAANLLAEAGRTRSALELAELLGSIESSSVSGVRVLESAAQPGARWPSTLAGLRHADAPLTRLRAFFEPLSLQPTQRLFGIMAALLEVGAWSHAVVFLYLVAARDQAAAASIVREVAPAMGGDWRGTLLARTSKDWEETEQILLNVELPIEDPLGCAVGHWRDGDISRAQQLLELLGTEGPPDLRPAARLVLAVLLRNEQNNYERAGSLLDLVVRQGDDRVAALGRLHRGVIRELAGALESAMADYRNAISTRYADVRVQAALRLGWLLFDERQPVEAAQVFGEVLSVAGPGDEEWLRLALGYGQSASRQGDHGLGHWLSIGESGDSLARGYAALLLGQAERHRPAGGRGRGGLNTHERRLLNNQDAAELWPIVLDALRPVTSEARIEFIAFWLAWLRLGHGSWVRLCDPRLPAVTMTLLARDRQRVWVHIGVGALNSRRAGQAVVSLDELGFEPTDPPTYLDETAGWWFCWNSAGADEETIAMTCEAAFVIGFGAKESYALAAVSQPMHPLEPTPRPPAPELLA
ncbi:caspase family protein [Micromonospora sp. C95]|uniref:caspase, EACC1-associated type n=1 Tax=Micromonospora sp. C95 TaxID=2824882 RepID=UPI001B36D28A|nr:caspase family protein [Micromonospora sp. C95]MBQ1028366.1 caspase family protein [Micromonospora sp. C95]